LQEDVRTLAGMLTLLRLHEDTSHALYIRINSKNPSSMRPAN
jgi:hypothetical protein